MPITSNFNNESTALDVVSGLDLSNRSGIVTGGSSGIGAEVVYALCSAGAHVTIASRHPSRLADSLGKRRFAKVQHLTTMASIDLASPASITAFARDISDKGGVNYLVNNAAVMAHPFTRTEGGHEYHFGVNHLGHFLLTLLLSPNLRAASAARVVSVTSSAHRYSDVDQRDPNFQHRRYDKWLAYGQSKTANCLFSVGITKHLSEVGIFSNAVMPGRALTQLQRYLNDSEVRQLGLIDSTGCPTGIVQSPEQAAATIVWAATSPELDQIGGKYLESCSEASPRTEEGRGAGFEPRALDPQRSDDLWKLSERMVGEYLPRGFRMG